MGCDRYAAVRCGGDVTPSCAPLTWGSLECCRFAAFLRLKPQASTPSALPRHSPYLLRKQMETPARCWRLVSVATRLVMGHWPGVRACCL